MTEKYASVNSWFCDKKTCKNFTKYDYGPYSDLDPAFREKMNRHDKCPDFQQGSPPDNDLAYGTVPDSIDKKFEFCITHSYRAENNHKQTQHEDNNQNCVWEIYNETKHHADFFKANMRNEKLTFTNTIGSKTTTKQVLGYKIKTLRPITYFSSENTKMILVYLPTKKTIEKYKTVSGLEELQSSEIVWINSAYFLISKLDDGVESREIIPFDDESLKENYRINILPEWNDVRWGITDCRNWVNESDKTEPKELYELLDDTVKKYLEYDDSEYSKFILWGIATYFYDLFSAFPYYDFTGTKRAGKTKSLEFQNHFCYNAIMSPDVTGSSLFRIIEGIGATILLDETEEFKNKKNDQAQTVRNLLMQAFLKDQYAIRSDTTKDKNFTPTQYNIYSPKSLAHINSFDDVLEDRCLRHTMKRGLNDAVKNTWVSEKDAAFQIIRNKCYRLFLDHADQIYDLQEEARTTLGISGRELQLWVPIMTLALFFEKNGIIGLTKTILNSMNISKEARQLNDEEESRDLKVLDYLSKFGVTLALNDKNEKALNPVGWIALGALYNSFSLIMEESYQIQREYFTRRTLSQTLDRFGFKKSRKHDGVSFLITENTVNEVKMRMGVLDDTVISDSAKITSFTSQTSQSEVNTHENDENINFTNNKETSQNQTKTSQSNSDDGRNCEVNEQNEVNEVKIEKSNVSFKCIDCNTTWINSKLSLDFIQTEHDKHNTGHTIEVQNLDVKS